VRIDNPVSLEEAWLRRELTPSLLRRVEHNFARGQGDVRLFELGTSFQAGAPGERPREEPRLAVVLTGDRAPAHWSGRSEAFDLWDLKALLEDVVARAGLDARLEPGAPAGRRVVPAEGFCVVAGDGALLGHGGRVDPAGVDAPPWATPVWAFELTLPAEPAPRPARRFHALPAFPGVERDLALLVPEAVNAGSVDRVISSAGGPHLQAVELFDLYRGAGIGEGSRSLAWRLRFRSPEKTLTDAEVDVWVQAIVRRLQEELNVGVRG
jgi:phenylalanyl-tRNA synthetase beta chain